MELPILTSKRGTRVVRATQLHRALGLSDHHYQANVRGWLKDVYQFVDGIRRPEGLKDYARSAKTKGQLFQEYYLQVEFAKLIALASKSKVKQAIATKLSKEEEVYPDQVRLDAQQMSRLLEITRAMTRITFQQAAEKRHHAHFSSRRGSGDYWRHFRREQIVLTTREELRPAAEASGRRVKADCGIRDLLLYTDELDTIRIGVVDHFAAQGKPMPYARQMGSMAKLLAREMQITVVDDRQGELLFAPLVDPELVSQLQVAA